MLAGNYMEYASYVIKDRAIPHVDDGLKPVQRRILHSLDVMDDGRFHKVANVIGHTMQYHPHGDASISAALVVLANKGFFIDRQGNFGNIYTGDPASAARYIECRLTPLARDVMFNREITEMQDSYDGRNQEPITLPSKVPSLLMMGADGIAVGMATHILPHNFGELLRAQISILRGEPFQVLPDFLQGGLMDVSEYEDGAGKVRLRARIEKRDDKTLIITELPASTTTESLTASVEDAAKRGRIKISSINDYTAETVEIEIKMARGAYAAEVINQLYAYTDCEKSVSSNIVVIKDNEPVEMTVSEILRHNTCKLVEYLKRELEIELGKLRERFHEKTLAQLFIENRIYKGIEEEESYENVVAAVHAGLAPFREQLTRDVTNEDVEKLLQIQIRRISRFDINRNRQELDDILANIKIVRRHLRHLVDYAIDHIQALLDKYAESYPRNTEIEKLEAVDVQSVALRNVKVGHDKTKHFIGTGVRNSNKNDPPLTCTEFDKLVLLRNDGVFKVIPIPEKLYTGPVKYLRKLDKVQIYSMVYHHRKRKTYFVKRFRIERFIMDREYKTLPPGCIIDMLSSNHGLVIQFDFKPSTRSSETSTTFDFSKVIVRSATARGYKVTDRSVQGFTFVDRGNAAPPAAEFAEREEADEVPEDIEEIAAESQDDDADLDDEPQGDVPLPAPVVEMAKEARQIASETEELLTPSPESVAEDWEKRAKKAKPTKVVAKNPPPPDENGDGSAVDKPEPEPEPKPKQEP
ncbi:MAG: DNA topoisomerase IV subunit A, partial [Lentisphaeria bacterium]|nr:DNA topoisomerase IV subunit A [Lentisphaeria bacterium]